MPCRPARRGAQSPDIVAEIDEYVRNAALGRQLGDHVDGVFLAEPSEIERPLRFRLGAQSPDIVAEIDEYVRNAALGRQLGDHVDGVFLAEPSEIERHSRFRKEY